MSGTSETPLVVPHSRVVLDEAAIDAVQAVLRSGQVSMGAQVQRLEEALSVFLGGVEVVAVSSGTAALHLVLEVLKGQGRQRVLLPSYTCVSLYNATVMAGMHAEIVDVEERTGNISADQVRPVLGSDISAVIVPHMFGCLADVETLRDMGLQVIEDCSHAIGAVSNGRKAGTLSDIAVFSFHATKMLPGIEGGAVACKDKQFADELRDLRDYTGAKGTWRLRYNYRLSDVHATVVVAHLSKLSTYVQRRKELARRYNQLLQSSPGVILPDALGCTDHIYYRYVVRLGKGYDVSKVRARMRAMGIGTGVGVLRALHEELGLPDEQYPNTSQWRRTALSLPIYPSLTEHEQDMVVRALTTALADEAIRGAGGVDAPSMDA